MMVQSTLYSDLCAQYDCVRKLGNPDESASERMEAFKGW